MSNKRAPTIFDVAEHAGVSTSTVSRTLNAHPSVDPATRNRVLQSVDALGFVPRSEAVSRARRGVGRIGVTAPFSAHSAYWRLMNGVMRGVAGGGVELSVFDQPSAVTSPSPALAALPLTDRVDGLIVMGTPLDDTVAARIMEGHLPTVLIESDYPGFSTVVIDNELEGRLAAGALLARGLRTVAFIGQRQASPDYEFSWGRREDGARAALTAAGVSIAAADTVLVGEDFDEAHDGARAILERHVGEPIGIIAHHDMLAAAAHRAALDLGLRIPDDVAIVGFDDSDLARALDLTSIHVPFEEAGEAAARLLLQSMAGTVGAQRVVLSSLLVSRASA